MYLICVSDYDLSADGRKGLGKTYGTTKTKESTRDEEEGEKASKRRKNG